MGFLSGINKWLGGTFSDVTGSSLQWERSLEAQRIANAFMERMSNSAHQRQVVDLRAAGLNPILSVRGAGAAVPNAAMAAAPDSGFGKGMQALSMIPQFRKVSSAISLAKAQTGESHAGASAKGAQAFAHKSKSIRDDAETELLREQRNLVNTQTESAKARVDATKALSAAAKVRGTTEEEIEKSWYGRTLRWLGRLNPFGSSAQSFVGAASGVQKMGK